MRRFIANAAALSAFALTLSVNAQQNILPFGTAPADVLVGLGLDYQNDTDLLAFLNVAIDAANRVPGAAFPAPTPNGSNFQSQSSVEAGDYLFLLYSTSDDAPGNSVPAGFDILFFENSVASFQIPERAQSTDVAGGGVIFARLFDHVPVTAPDGGTTIALLGLGLIGMGVVGKKAIHA